MTKRQVKLFLTDTSQASLAMLQANYEAPLLQAATTATYKTAGFLYAAAASRRIMLYEIEFGQVSLPASTDCQCQWDVSRASITAILTASAVVPNLLDPSDSTTLALFQNNATTETTYTTAGNGLNLKNWGINQRGSYRWRALDDGDNLIIPATVSSAIVIRTLSSNFTGSSVGNISFVER